MGGVERDMLTPPTVAVIGGGQLARMMQESAIALGINLRVLVEAEDGSTGLVTVDKAVGAPKDLDAVRALIDGADVLTFEHEHIPAQTMEEAARVVSVQPPAPALLYAQDKLQMRARLSEMGIPCPAWARVDNAAELERFGAGHRLAPHRQDPARRLRRPRCRGGPQSRRRRVMVGRRLTPGRGPGALHG